ncbi:DUF6011 domain-containing protein [Streptomyces sp. NRRL F-5135]|uniref:DUF6011 domain-containing protein n=1 Tax=Streptomyces sp. NRRL F-5135 TaxID=1463858 RepID=UPI003B63A330
MPSGVRMPDVRCGGCRRLLLDPVSRRRGLGPVCARALAAPDPARVPAPTITVDVIPGQTVLPLVDHQPTLWSL